MSGESMEQLLKHIYTGSTDNFKNLQVDVVLELLNASNKVNSSRISGTSPFEWIRPSSINSFFELFVIYTVRTSPAECEKILVHFCTLENALDGDRGIRQTVQSGGGNRRNQRL
jgi:hypothetical protein